MNRDVYLKRIFDSYFDQLKLIAEELVKIEDLINKGSILDATIRTQLKAHLKASGKFTIKLARYISETGIEIIKHDI